MNASSTPQSLSSLYELEKSSRTAYSEPYTFFDVESGTHPAVLNESVDLLGFYKKYISADVLFVIERSLNQNVVLYKLRRNAQNQVDWRDPIEVFWIIVPENFSYHSVLENDAGSSSSSNEDSSDEEMSHSSLSDLKSEALNFIEKQYVYGITRCQRMTGDSGVRFSLKILKNHEFILTREQDGTFRVYTQHRSQKMYIHRIQAFLYSSTSRTWKISNVIVPSLEYMYLEYTTVRSSPTLHLRRFRSD